jgi:hypothetical protein
MSRRHHLPHCVYCGLPTSGGESRIDGKSPICQGCAHGEQVLPLEFVDRWLNNGLDREAAIVFVDRFNRRHTPPPATRQIGGAL